MPHRRFQVCYQPLDTCEVGWQGASSISVPWLVINIGLALLGGDVGVMQIAWTAHLGGLAAGFAFPAFRAFARS
ncbi:MAG: rhomboid family intramembrane serine protease [Henriciella sp.]|nr:rhomboid family intramembrane serine protease [Henriciella sp.]